MDADKKAELPWCCLALPYSVCMNSGNEEQRAFPGEQESLLRPALSTLSLLDPRDTHRPGLG